MSAPPPPPPPIRGPPPPVPARPTAPPVHRPGHPSEALFREQGVLERRLPTFYTVHLTAEERAWIPSDFPDILDLGNLTNVLALVGPNARFSQSVIMELQAQVKQVAQSIQTFKQHGDAVMSLKEQFKKTGDVDITTVQTEVAAARSVLSEVQNHTDALKKRVYQLREEQMNAPPMTGGGLEPRIYPLESAEWLVKPVYYFKEYEPDPIKHTVIEFVHWIQYAMEDPAQRHLAVPLVTYVGALKHSGLVDADLLRSRVSEYMKYFKSSLPESLRLVEAPPSKKMPSQSPWHSRSKSPKLLGGVIALEPSSTSLSPPPINHDTSVSLST